MDRISEVGSLLS